MYVDNGLARTIRVIVVLANFDGRYQPELTRGLQKGEEMAGGRKQVQGSSWIDDRWVVLLPSVCFPSVSNRQGDRAKCHGERVRLEPPVIEEGWGTSSRRFVARRSQAGGLGNGKIDVDPTS